MNADTVPLIQVKGDARGRGTAVGSQYRDRIRATRRLYADTVFATSKLGAAEITARAGRVRTLVGDFKADYCDEIDAMADADGHALSVEFAGMRRDDCAPTYLLQHFVRDRPRGPRVDLSRAVRMQTADTAPLYGFRDRGRIAPGLRADLNLIDLERLALPMPEMVCDLPAQGQRLIQRAIGYRLTMLAGTVTLEHGEVTGALPGRLVRGRTG